MSRPRLDSRVLEERALRTRADLARANPYWPAQLAVLAAIVLYFALPEKLTLGPTWLLPAFEGLLLAGLVLTTPWPQLRHHRHHRRLALGLVALVSVVNLASLALLVHYLIQGGKTGGHPLISAGVVLWVTNVLLFGLWYWELDRGGPLTRIQQPATRPDFLFPQMSDSRLAGDSWQPGFVDYLYVSLTNATAFSPTDTMPLTQRAKAVMALQALASLVTVGLVVARAVNILS